MGSLGSVRCQLVEDLLQMVDHKPVTFAWTGMQDGLGDCMGHDSTLGQGDVAIKVAVPEVNGNLDVAD